MEGRFYLFYQIAKCLFNSDNLKKIPFAQVVRVDKKAHKYNVKTQIFREYYSNLIKYEITDIKNNDKNYSFDCIFKYTINR